MERVLAVALAAVTWLVPAPVLPIPSRSGAEGPPRPFTAEPPWGSAPAPTPRRVVRAQDRALLRRPLPRRQASRAGSPTAALLLSADPATRRLALERIRATGATVVRIPVDWRELVAARPAGGLRRNRPRRSLLRLRPPRRSRQERRARRASADPGGVPRAGLRRSARPLALRLPRQLGPRPGGAGSLRAGARRPLRRELPRPERSRCRAAARDAASRPGTSPTWPATWSRSGWSGKGTGRRSRRCCTGNCSTPSTPGSSWWPRTTS